MECDICQSTQHFRRECLQGDGGGRGPLMHMALTDSDIQESLLADPADGSAAVVNVMAARRLGASMYLENCADRLFEE
eukprot:5756935-Pyramimonas_sp.AAC.1